MAFVKFNKIGSIYKSRASISNKGVISLNQGAANQFKLSKENALYVELFYDEEAKKIGLKFHKGKIDSVANVRHRETGLHFSARSLLDYYQIQPKATSLYQVEGMDDMVIIDLTTGKERGKKQKE